jgi:hypothetical protein
LKRRQLYDNAVILFISDHGEELFEHDGFGHSRGKVFGESIRVPLIVKPVKGDFPGGVVVPTQERAFDVMPTLLELAGIPVPNDIDARSLVPLLSKAGPDRVAVSETHSKNFAVRTRRWKYIYNTTQDQEPAEYLYDLENDPVEQSDVFAEHPTVTECLRLQLFNYLLLGRSGNYLIAIGAENSKPFETTVRSVDNDQPLGIAPLYGLKYGVHVDVADDGSLQLRSNSDQHLAFIVTLNEVDRLLIGEASTEPQQFRLYEDGDLQRLLNQADPSLYLFSGPPPHSQERAVSRTIDL